MASPEANESGPPGSFAQEGWPAAPNLSPMFRRALLGALAVTALSVVASPAFARTPRTTPSRAWVPPRADHWSGHGFDPANPAACDPIDPAQCMLPYPNDWLTRSDPSSATGRRLDLTLAAMPRNAEGKPIEPQEWNRSDGFSAGAQILTVVPGMTTNQDVAASGMPPVTDLAANDNPDSGVVLLDTQTGRRWPVWVEVDQYTQEAGVLPATAVQHDLMIHPAANLADGHRYIVALRHVVGDNGQVVAPSPAFAAYRDGTAPPSDPRTAHMNRLFATLAEAGVARRDLYLAWDFTTASTKNVAGRLLSIRDQAFADLGVTPRALAAGTVTGRAPSFTVDKVTEDPADKQVARQVMGHFTVPCFIAPTCSPPAKCDTISQGILGDCPLPGQFALDPTKPDALPRRVPGQTYSANFICNLGRAAFDAHQKLRPVEYGHGLFGGAGEVNADPQRQLAQNFGMMYCATDWYGMATADVPNALVALHDLSRFPFVTDRVQQGELDFLYLARLMIHPSGFGANPAFQFADHTPVIDSRQAFYDGNSQGGIYGGTVCAVSVDVRRCALGVPGMDYSILLPRSSDYVAEKPLTSYDPTKFNPSDPQAGIGYSTVFDLSYPDQAQRMLILDLIQTLWDRSDPNGYATHITAGLPHTPSHRVLLQAGYGDHQVANITAETEARSIGAAGLQPPLVAARYGPYHNPFWGIPTPSSFPYQGSRSRCSTVGRRTTSPLKAIAARTRRRSRTCPTDRETTPTRRRAAPRVGSSRRARS